MLEEVFGVRLGCNKIDVVCICHVIFVSKIYNNFLRRDLARVAKSCKVFYYAAASIKLYILS